MEEVLSPKLSFEEFKLAIESFGGRWVQRIPKGEAQLWEEIWELPDNRGNVRYIFDHYVAIPYVSAESDRYGAPGNIIRDLLAKADLPIIDRGQLERLGKSPDVADRKFSLRGYVATTDRFHWGVVQGIEAALKDPVPRCAPRHWWPLHAIRTSTSSTTSKSWHAPRPTLTTRPRP